MVHTKRAPKNWTNRLPDETYLKRQIMLTAQNVWHNQLTLFDVEGWLSNFLGRSYSAAYERRLALWLLANFVYYNETEVRHLCRDLFDRFVHVLVTSRTPTLEHETSTTLNELLEQVRFYHLGRASESGAFVLYLFRQENCLPVSHFSAPRPPPPTVRHLAFVDDVTLSGSQASRYIKRELGSGHSTIPTYLLTFIATHDAIRHLAKHGVTVISCIQLDQRSKLFSSHASAFRGFLQDLVPCQAISKVYGTRIFPEHPLGFNDGQYAFGFYYNTPNNTLPIFWAAQDGWKPLFTRYHKLDGKQHATTFGRFI